MYEHPTYIRGDKRIAPNSQVEGGGWTGGGGKGERAGGKWGARGRFAFNVLSKNILNDGVGQIGIWLNYPLYFNSLVWA